MKRVPILPKIIQGFHFHWRSLASGMRVGFHCRKAVAPLKRLQRQLVSGRQRPFPLPKGGSLPFGSGRWICQRLHGQPGSGSYRSLSPVRRVSRLANAVSLAPPPKPLPRRTEPNGETFEAGFDIARRTLSKLVLEGGSSKTRDWDKFVIAGRF